MGENTKIAWADNTWNPWQGCHKVSPGCANCYMYRDKKRYGKDPSTVIRSQPATFNKPLHWKDPASVFVCSWSDFFIIEADEWRNDAWDIIRKTPHLTYLLLTKRPENIRYRLPSDWPLPNVWLGVTAENQEQADKRIPILCGIPAAKRFVSVEPMVSPVDFDIIPPFDLPGDDRYGTVTHYEAPWDEYIDWVIVGGESGTGARPVHPDWVRFLRDQCEAYMIPFMFKQWGEWAPNCLCDTVKSHPAIKRPEPGKPGIMFKCGTKNAGHLLDGVEHMEIPVY